MDQDFFVHGTIILSVFVFIYTIDCVSMAHGIRFSIQYITDTKLWYTQVQIKWHFL